ncbi:MAG: 6-bladed beta-propeller, partial [Tannerella sp.]|nr:6-bladed beta-propeller [Tannerella sp.]
MNKNIFFVIVTALFLVYACGDSQQSDDSSIETISIDENDRVEEVDATFLLDTTFARMVLLELNDESLIGEVSSIHYKNNKIIIFDEMTNGVYIFNDDGSYYSKIHAVGGGPGEYTSDVKFALATDSTIAVLDPFINKILYYNYEGKHLYDIRLHGAYGNVFNTFDNRAFHLVAQWGFSSIGKYGYFCIDNQKGIVDKKLPFTDDDVKIGRGWGLDNAIYNGKERSLALRTSMDTIWEITSENIFRSCYYIDIVRHKMPRAIAEGNVDKAFD